MKKTIIIIIFITLIFVGLYFSFVFLSNNQNENGENNEGGFFPISGIRDIFGGRPEVEDPGENEQTQTENIPEQSGDFTTISENEVAGFTIGNNGVLYVEAGTGYFFEHNKETGQTKQITNTTIPGVKRVWINPTNTTINSLIGNIQNDETRVISVSFEKPEQGEVSSFETNEVVGDFLSASVSPNKTQRFVLQEFNGGSVGVIENITNNNSQQIFSSPFKNWNIDWSNENLITLSSKGSAFTPGLVSLLNTQNQSLKTVLSGVLALTSKTSPDGSKIIYTEKAPENSFLELKVLNTTNPNNNSLLTFVTLADKCVWSKNSITIFCGVNKTFPSGNLPDDWYQGKTLFNEDVWVVNTESGQFSYITAGENQKIDILQPVLDENEEFLYFINKHDSKLWSVDLRGDNNI